MRVENRTIRRLPFEVGHRGEGLMRVGRVRDRRYCWRAELCGHILGRGLRVFCGRRALCSPAASVGVGHALLEGNRVFRLEDVVPLGEHNV